MNVGAGVDHSIRDFYELAADVVGFDGELRFDTTKPSGVPPPAHRLDARPAARLGAAHRHPRRHGRVLPLLPRTAPRTGDLR